MTVTFHQSPIAHLAIEVLGYAHPQAEDYHDLNWLNVRIQVHAGKFTGQADAYFLSYEIKSFYESLKNLHQSLSGAVEFKTLEDQLFLRFETLAGGGIHLRGHLMDVVGTGNSLDFHWETDQSYLVGPLSELENVVRSFPIRTPSNRNIKTLLSSPLA